MDQQIASSSAQGDLIDETQIANENRLNLIKKHIEEEDKLNKRLVNNGFTFSEKVNQTRKKRKPSGLSRFGGEDEEEPNKEQFKSEIESSLARSTSSSKVHFDLNSKSTTSFIKEND